MLCADTRHLSRVDANLDANQRKLAQTRRRQATDLWFFANTSMVCADTRHPSRVNANLDANQRKPEKG